MAKPKSSKTLGVPTKVNAGKTGDYNHSSDWANEYIPETIYYYYVTSVGAGYKATVYFWDEMAPIPMTSLEGHIIRPTRNARSANNTNPRPIGRGFGRIPWWRRSYLVIVLEDGNGFEPGQAVQIRRKDGSPNGHPNHCFFDGGDGKITLPAPELPIYALWTVNYMKSKSGKDIPEGKSHRFAFKFFGNERGLLYPEDSGTNMGPPVPPP
jgi:hypothetical protein